jgi:hypothetical protein
MALANSMLAAFVAFASAFTALAAGVDLHGFGREVWRSKPSEAHVIHLKAPPTLRIVIGGETLELERTTLPDLVKRFGGPSSREATPAVQSIGSATTMLQRGGPCGSSLTKWAGATSPSWRSRWRPTAAVIRMAALGLRRRSRTLRLIFPRLAVRLRTSIMRLARGSLVRQRLFSLVQSRRRARNGRARFGSGTSLITARSSASRSANRR